MTSQNKSNRMPTITLAKRKVYLAFIDILGFKELIYKIDTSTEKDSPEFTKLATVILKLKERVIFDNENHEELDYLFISDTIVLMSPSFEKACWKTSQIIDTFIEFNFLTRGAITYGNIMLLKDGHSPNASLGKNIFGLPFQRAYELEQKHAVHPRVIIDQEIINDLEASSPVWLPKLLRRDEDGWRYVDHFIRKYEKESDEHDLDKYLVKVKKNIETNLKYFLQKSEYTKWYWIKTQFNRHAKDNGYNNFLIE